MADLLWALGTSTNLGWCSPARSYHPCMTTGDAIQDADFDEEGFQEWLRRRDRRKVLLAAVAGSAVISLAAFFAGVAVGRTDSPSPLMTPCGATGAVCPVGNQIPGQQNPQSNPLQQHQQAVAACEAQAAAENGGQPLRESQIVACSTIP